MGHWQQRCEACVGNLTDVWGIIQQLPYSWCSYVSVNSESGGPLHWPLGDILNYLEPRQKTKKQIYFLLRDFLSVDHRLDFQSRGALDVEASRNAGILLPTVHSWTMQSVLLLLLSQHLVNYQ